jgi:hypothetical protein
MADLVESPIQHTGILQADDPQLGNQLRAKFRPRFRRVAQSFLDQRDRIGGWIDDPKCTYQIQVSPLNLYRTRCQIRIA